MSQRPQLLIIGHSHIECLSAAYAEQAFDAEVHFLNLRLLEKEDRDTPLFQKVKAQTRGLSPGALCLCVGGNRHNILGLFEHPERFCVGAADVGAIPPDAGARTFIPRALMTELFEHTLRRNLTFALCNAFPDVPRLFMNPPPPVGDAEHIKKYPGAFRDKLALGTAPDALRLYLYQIQSETIRAVAQEARATFVDVAPTLVDDRGFLAEGFYDSDVTHGNTAYGAVMLRRVLDTVGVAA